MDKLKIQSIEAEADNYGPRLRTISQPSAVSPTGQCVICQSTELVSPVYCGRCDIIYDRLKQLIKESGEDLNIFMRIKTECTDQFNQLNFSMDKELKGMPDVPCCQEHPNWSAYSTAHRDVTHRYDRQFCDLYDNKKKRLSEAFPELPEKFIKILSGISDI